MLHAIIDIYFKKDQQFICVKYCKIDEKVPLLNNTTSNFAQVFYYYCLFKKRCDYIHVMKQMSDVSVLYIYHIHSESRYNGLVGSINKNFQKSVITKKFGIADKIL